MSGHVRMLEQEIAEVHPVGGGCVRRELTGRGQFSCSCGVDTGMVGLGEARAVQAAHEGDRNTMNDCQVTLTIPALTVHADDRAGRDRIRNALDGSLTLGAKVVGNVAADGDELTYTIRAEGSLDQLRPLTDWLAEHDYPSPVRAASPPPSDEEIRAFLERHPAAFRMFLDRAWRTDPGWLRGVLRRDARIRGGRREWPD